MISQIHLPVTLRLLLLLLHKTVRPLCLFVCLFGEAHCISVDSVKRLDLYSDTLELYADTWQPERLSQ